MELTLFKMSVRRKLYLIYGLNIADWLCTIVLLRSGDFIEVNPIMNAVIHSIPLGLAVKCILPAIIITVIIGMLSQLGYKDTGTVDRVVSFAAAFYTLLCVDHIVNFMILFFS